MLADFHRRAPLVAAVVLALAGSVVAATLSPVGAAAAPSTTTLHLGYFPNVTHAPALVGVESGLFQQDLGPNVKLSLTTFNAGPAAGEALLSGSIDATYVGPNPAINAFVQSHGGVRVVSGAASGGAFLVVRPGITKAADLKGKVLASPQLGNTQDVALRTYLSKHGLKTDVSGGGDVSIRPQDNAVTLQAFEQKQIDGAWVPEPWATRLVTEGGGKVLVDERTLWPHGTFVTTELLVRTDFLQAHPDVVQSLLTGQVDAVHLIATNPTRAEQLVGQGIVHATGKSLAPSIIAASFQSITFTNDPIASSLQTTADNAKKLGLLKSANLKGLYDLRLLNKVLKARQQPVIAAP
ncbi:MAG TPA: ABC transporter substrate-binding protein [Acidimicrobiia bacterium]|nr:ABC transporter substrate-binding protein [Acidimicrobiia bacterium]